VKVLQVVDKPQNAGGVGFHVSEVCAALRKRGHEAELLHLGAAGASAQNESHLPFTYGLLRGYLNRVKLERILQKLEPQVIHLQGCFTTLSPLLIDTMRQYAPTLATLHDVRPFCYLMTRRVTGTGILCSRRCGLGCFTSGCVRPAGAVDLLRQTRRWTMDALALRRWCQLDRIVVPSGYLADLAIAHGFPPERMRVVPHGTSLPTMVKAADGTDAPPLIAFVGSLFEQKGIFVLLEALQRLATRPWHAVIAGDGPFRSTLEARLAEGGLLQRVTLPGAINDREELGRLYAQARLVVVPSLIPESFCLVGIEALAAGTPVVSFGLGGQAEWLRDGENSLVAAGCDAADLARKIACLLDAPSLAYKLGQQGRRMVAASFNSEQSMDALVEVYGEVIAERSVTRI
jgi:glycosyltransferase involved in cell wall biosynthesis